MAKDHEVERIAKKLDKMVHKKNTVSWVCQLARQWTQDQRPQHQKSGRGEAVQEYCGVGVMHLCSHRTIWKATERCWLFVVLNLKKN